MNIPYDKGIVVYISNTVFDAVEHIPDFINGDRSKPNTEKKVMQFMGDLPACLDVIEAFKKAMVYYDLTAPANTYLLHNAKQSTCMATMSTIKKRLKEDPETNYLIFFVCAGHGMNASGQQVLLINEFKAYNSFYKWIGIEGDIRQIAKDYPNSYTLAFFACCREIYSTIKHRGWKKGDLQK